MSSEQRQKGPPKNTKSATGDRLRTAHCPLPTKYIELHARSAFSFLEGASVPEELIAAALKFEMPAMALMDRDGVYGSPRFHLAAKKNGIKAHIGAEITVQSPMSNVQCPKMVQRPMSNVQRHKTKDQNGEADIGHWTSISGRWTSISGHWTLDIGHWTSISGHWTLDIGHWTSNFFHPRPGSYPHWLSKSLSINHSHEVACIQTCETGRVCRHT